MANLFDELKRVKKLHGDERAAAETRLRDTARSTFDQFYAEAKEEGWEDHQIAPIEKMEKEFIKSMLEAS